jgi:RNA polymerase sigma-70 factor (ECF subfamily)
MALAGAALTAPPKEGGMQHRADLELARRAAAADRTAFAALFEDSFERVYAFASRRTADRQAAERVAERCLALAFARLADYDGRTPFSAWLLGLLKRELGAARADRGAERARRAAGAGAEALVEMPE